MRTLLDKGKYKTYLIDTPIYLEYNKMDYEMG